jgi:hypothetical protein
MKPSAPADDDANAQESRRALLTAGAGMLLAANTAIAQQPHIVSKGPRVFLDYDQAALDAAYDQSLRAERGREARSVHDAASERAHSGLRAWRRMARR